MTLHSFQRKHFKEKGLIGAFSLFLTTGIASFSQISDTGSNLYAQHSSWAENPFEHKLFIQNNGQFDGKDMLSDSKIYYGVDNLGAQIYFSNKGLTYRYDDPEFIFSDENEMNGSYEKSGEEKKIISHTFKLNIEWLNSNPQVKIISEDKGETYFNYAVDYDPAHTINFVPGYKKIKYINLYPGVDLEYAFHKESGIKYALIVHPGADASKIKMKYSGNGNLLKDPEGNIRFSTPYGDIIDHAPVTFYENKALIASEFHLDNNIVSFELAAYDHSKTIVVDPWTQNPALTALNRAYDIHKDGSGNIYVCGGSAPRKLQKYPPAGGVATWVFNTPFNFLYGDMIVDAAGVSYISQVGWGFNDNYIAKVNRAGVMVWNTTDGPGGASEYFSMALDCSGNNLCVTSGIGNYIIRIDTANGAVISANNAIGVNGTAVSGDSRVLIMAPNGNYYALSGERRGLLASTGLFVPLFTTLTGYLNSYGGPGYTGGHAGADALDASKTFLYSTDGLAVHKWNLSTGVAIANINVPGGIVDQNDGIAVDSCSNVYVGSQAAVYKYNSNLNLITSLATPGPVHCVSMGSNGEILASGLNFIASLNFNACPIIPPSVPLSTTVQATPASCSSSNGTASITATGGNSSLYTYLWNPTSQTTQTATGLSAGIYTVTVTDKSSFCFIKSQTTTVAVTSSGSLSLAGGSTPVACSGGNNGSATVSVISGGTPGYTYSWSPIGGTTSAASNLIAGIYTAIVTDASGCSSTQTITITQPAALSTTIISTGATCNSSNGAASVTAAGGSGSYTYLWSNGGTTSQISNLTSQIYTVTVADANNCTRTTSVSITTTSGPAINSIPTHVLCKGGNTGSVAATGSGGTLPYTYAWNNGATNSSASGLIAGTYTLAITDFSGCTSIQTVTITEPLALTTGTTSTPSKCAGNDGTATANAGGGTPGYTYVWNNGQLTPTATGLAKGTYSITITDTNGCTNTATVTVTELLCPCPTNMQLALPNAFSPNNDTENDEFCLQGAANLEDCIKELKITIYNRWGEKVYESDDTNFCWDGMYQGKPQNTSVFVYYLDAILMNGDQIITQKGNVSLIR